MKTRFDILQRMLKDRNLHKPDPWCDIPPPLLPPVEQRTSAPAESEG